MAESTPTEHISKLRINLPHKTPATMASRFVSLSSSPHPHSLDMNLIFALVHSLSGVAVGTFTRAWASTNSAPLNFHHFVYSGQGADDILLKSRFGGSSLHQRDPRSALFENYNGGSGERKAGSASPSRPGSYAGGYGYAGAANGSAGGLGVQGPGYRPATPNSR